MIMILEYIWLDNINNFRSKTKVCEDIDINDINNLQKWNYDGSSTKQVDNLNNTEIILEPTVIFKDPFRRNQKSYLVWCNMLFTNNNYLDNSNRKFAENILNKYKSELPWFGLEQEYYIVNSNNEPINNLDLFNQHKYYCGIGGCDNLERSIAELHLEYCLYAGIKICGLNREVSPSQWEYQIGPCEGIKAGDHLWVSRYILNRVAELYNYNISYHPKLINDNKWSGSGLHTNFSTTRTRNKNGLSYIYSYIKKLKENHNEHMKYYGENNNLRMTGENETSKFGEFTFGIGSRNTSIRIPNDVLKNNGGYFEDRRVGSNADPYLVIGLLMKTCFENDNIGLFNNLDYIV